jgi:hypothetical protein
LIRFQADADLRHSIVTAVRRLEPAISFASAVDSGITGLADPEILEFAAGEGRILVSHDRRTIIHHFRNHLAARKSSPGVFLVPQSAPLGPIAEVLVVVWAVSEAEEWRDQLRHLPSLSRHVFSR